MTVRASLNDNDNDVLNSNWLTLTSPPFTLLKSSQNVAYCALIFLYYVHFILWKFENLEKKLLFQSFHFKTMDMKIISW